MGAHLGRRYLWDAEVEPDPLKMPTFDSQYGFPERKERDYIPKMLIHKVLLDSNLDVCLVKSPVCAIDYKNLLMIATQQQMNDAQLPLAARDYCAHYLIKFMKCKRDYFPNIFACKHERHDWDYCEHLDYVMRMKEFERERRLLARKKRIEQKEKAAAAAS